MKNSLLYFLFLLTGSISQAALLQSRATTPNKLSSLGDPEIIPKNKIKNNEKFPQYDLWTNSPCDESHPHPATEGRPWQEFQFDGPETCINFQPWKPHKASGYTFRVEDWSILDESQTEGPCMLMVYPDADCKGKMADLEARVGSSEPDSESRCWSFDPRAFSKSAIIRCEFAKAGADESPG